MAQQQSLPPPSYITVLLYVPNLIGYARVILTIISMLTFLTLPTTTVMCYASSFILDFFDGHAARALNQCSNFGSVLDMVTDRCSTAYVYVMFLRRAPTSSPFPCSLKF